jgi:hypothetical protein
LVEEVPSLLSNGVTIGEEGGRMELTFKEEPSNYALIYT